MLKSFLECTSRFDDEIHSVRGHCDDRSVAKYEEELIEVDARTWNLYGMFYGC
jgi:hypothetical protein